MSFNYEAIITASVASVVLGTLYGVIFRKAALASMGKQEGEIQVARTVSRFREYTGAILLDCFIALGLSYLIIHLEIDNLVRILGLTFWVFIGFVAPLTISAFLRKNITFQNWLFNAFINAICLFVMIVILTYWR